jgi:uncharacterized membrane protein YwaF
MADKTISEKVWGFKLADLTYTGIADIMIDITKIIICLIIFWDYNYAFSETGTPNTPNTSPLVWIGAVLLLAVMIYVFFPALTRLLYGRYTHWVRKEENTGEQQHVWKCSYKKV